MDKELYDSIKNMFLRPSMYLGNNAEDTDENRLTLIYTAIHVEKIFNEQRLPWDIRPNKVMSLANGETKITRDIHLEIIEEMNELLKTFDYKSLQWGLNQPKVI